MRKKKNGYKNNKRTEQKIVKTTDNKIVTLHTYTELSRGNPML